MSSKLDESEEYDDDFEEVSDDEGPHSASPAPAPAQATPSTAAAAASSGGSGPTFTSQSSGGHAEAQEWEDVAFGDVTLGKKLGGGGFAIVYEGQWKGRKVALKTLFDPSVDDALKTEFMDELHVMRSLSHPNIVEFLGACTKPPKMFIIMELCARGSLFNLLHNTSTKLSYGQRVPLLTDVARGMAFLHSRSPPIVHRDLKSHNLLIDAKWAVKLCDFGLVTTKYGTAGTPQYLAPELMQAQPFSRKVDVYAFGCLLWETLCRRVPFNGWKATDIVNHVTKGGRPDTTVFGLDAEPVGELIELMQACWAQDSAARPEFADILVQLEQWKPRQSAVAAAASRLGGGDALDSMLSSKSGSRSRRK